MTNLPETCAHSKSCSAFARSMRARPRAGDAIVDPRADPAGPRNPQQRNRDPKCRKSCGDPTKRMEAFERRALPRRQELHSLECARRIDLRMAREHLGIANVAILEAPECIERLQPAYGCGAKRAVAVVKDERLRPHSIRITFSVWSPRALSSRTK